MSYCILMAGMPGAGQINFGDYLTKTSQLSLFAYDRIAARLQETLGKSIPADNLHAAAQDMMYYAAESLMRARDPFVLVHSFDIEDKARLQRMLHAFEYRSVLVRFEGDTETVYTRYCSALNEKIRMEQELADQLGEIYKMPALPTLEEYTEMLQHKGIAGFTLGSDEIPVDVTDLDKVQYKQLAKQIQIHVRNFFR